MNALIRHLLVALCVLSASAAVQADDWLRFRGPNGTGLSDTKFDAPITEKDFKWKVELPGTGHSCPVVRGDRVYLTSADPAAGLRYVLCLSAKDGKTIWSREFKFDKFKQHADNSYASATPALDELGVYVAWSTPDKLELLALDHDGKDRWQADLGKFISQQGSGASPVVVDEVVVLINDQEGPASTVNAYDRKTGSGRWKIERVPGNKTALATPVIYEPKGGPKQLILSNKATGVTSVNPGNGTVNWEVPDACPARTVGSPLIAGDLILATNGEGANTRDLVAIRPPKASDGPDGTAKPTVAYKLSKIPPYVPTALEKDGTLYLWCDNGTFTAVKAATGEMIFEGKTPGQYYGSPVCAGNTLWAMNRRGKLVGVSTGEKFKLVGELDLGEPSHATPAIAGGCMYLRTLSHLICVTPPKK